ncbi:MAG: 50S ribosomal protein L24 [Planctomycetota bacterium]|nr:MAG: 50S ribosomal protein L24 [Planctomycetota bacterium]
MAKIKKNDMVVVIAGKRKRADYEGQPRKVLGVFPDENKVLVEGHRIMKKHVRPSKDNPKGGRIEKEAPVDISNVMLFCPHCEKPVRVGFTGVKKDKKRICKKCKKEV